MAHNNFTAIDIFAGAGGLSLGAQWAGIPVGLAIEKDEVAARTYRQNHPHTDVVVGDIRSFAPPSRPRGKRIVLFGGPPCQGFSTSNQRTRGASNAQNWLFKEFIRYASALKPHWIVLENVKGIQDTARGQFADLILGSLAEIGYKTAMWTLCASHYGVPQKRGRIFFVGSREGKAPSPPRLLSSDAPTTLRQAISDLPSLEIGASTNELRYAAIRPSEYAKTMRGNLVSCSGHLVTKNNNLVRQRYRHIPPGGNWCDIPRRLMSNYSNLTDQRSRHSGIYRRLEWDKPSVVIANYRKNMLVHPSEDRGLSVREACRIQSFPDWYEFSGSIGQQQQQVSNAVPPLLAKAVFEAIKADF